MPLSLEYWPVIVALPVAVFVVGHAVFAALSYVAYRRKA